MKVILVFLVLVQDFLGGECLNFRSGKQGRQATFERFDNNCGDRSLPIGFNYQGMRSDGGKLTINSTITVKEDNIKEPWVLVQINRCKNRDNLDTCEHFYDHKVENYCDMIGSDYSMWSPFFSTYVPRFKCPVQKGFYRAINSELDARALLMFPLDAWYWRVKVDISEKATGRMVSCIIVETHISTSS